MSFVITSDPTVEADPWVYIVFTDDGHGWAKDKNKARALRLAAEAVVVHDAEAGITDDPPPVFFVTLVEGTEAAVAAVAAKFGL